MIFALLLAMLHPGAAYSGAMGAQIEPADTNRTPTAVDVVGMAPQLAVITHDAAARGWRIVCHGRSGEERVVRIAFPAGTPKTVIDYYFTGSHAHGSSAHFLYDGKLSGRCDRAPDEASGPSHTSVLTLGRKTTLDQLLGIARTCGFKRAKIRRQRAGDIPSGMHGVDPNLLVLDAGEDVGQHLGPSFCFMQMSRRAMAASSHRKAAH